MNSLLLLESLKRLYLIKKISDEKLKNMISEKKISETDFKFIISK